VKIFRWLAVTAALAVSSTAHAQPSLFLEELSSTELQSAIRAGKNTILIPIGGTEWNGPNIALGKHNARAKLLASRIAAKLGNALVAPVIAYVPEGRIDPPTLHMRHSGTISIPDDAFEKTLESAARSLLHHGFTRVVLLGDHGGYAKNLNSVARRVPGVVVPKAYYRDMEHAGPDDTAATLAVDPRLVRDPKGATAERGSALLDAIVEATAKELSAKPR
jgi:creatinine amidohydrolase